MSLIPNSSKKKRRKRHHQVNHLQKLGSNMDTNMSELSMATADSGATDGRSVGSSRTARTKVTLISFLSPRRRKGDNGSQRVRAKTKLGIPSLSSSLSVRPKSKRPKKQAPLSIKHPMDLRREAESKERKLREDYELALLFPEDEDEALEERDIDNDDFSDIVSLNDEEKDALHRNSLASNKVAKKGEYLKLPRLYESLMNLDTPVLKMRDLSLFDKPIPSRTPKIECLNASGTNIANIVRGKQNEFMQREQFENGQSSKQNATEKKESHHRQASSTDNLDYDRTESFAPIGGRMNNNDQKAKVLSKASKSAKERRKDMKVISSSLEGFGRQGGIKANAFLRIEGPKQVEEWVVKYDTKVREFRFYNTFTKEYTDTKPLLFQGTVWVKKFSIATGNKVWYNIVSKEECNSVERPDSV